MKKFFKTQNLKRYIKTYIAYRYIKKYNSKRQIELRRITSLMYSEGSTRAELWVNTLLKDQERLIRAKAKLKTVK